MQELIEHRDSINRQLARYGVKFGIYKNGNFQERLFPFDPESRSESVQLDLFISGSYDGPDRVPGSWIYVTSLSGTVEVTTGGEAYRLENRDCLSFPGSQPYRYENVGNNTVRLIQRTVYKK